MATYTVKATELYNKDIYSYLLAQAKAGKTIKLNNPRYVEKAKTTKATNPVVNVSNATLKKPKYIKLGKGYHFPHERYRSAWKFDCDEIKSRV